MTPAALNNRPFIALGIDVGGTKIAAGLVAFPQARILEKQTFPTRPEQGGEAVLNEVIRVSTELLASCGRSGVDAVGVGVCELVSPDGRLLSANCLAWRDLDVVGRLSHLGPVILEADVRAAALAEARWGAGKPHRLFLYITVGTGIASCLVIDGQPFTGARGATGTMASSPMSFPCEQCGRLNRRTLEELAAGPALVERFNRIKPGSARSGQDVLAAVATGDPSALDVVRSAGEALESAVGLLVNVLDPEAVIIGGGLGLSNGSYWEEFIGATRRHIWSDVHRDVPILRASTGGDAGLIGAATAAWERALS